MVRKRIATEKAISTPTETTDKQKDCKAPTSPTFGKLFRRKHTIPYPYTIKWTQPWVKNFDPISKTFFDFNIVNSDKPKQFVVSNG